MSLQAKLDRLHREIVSALCEIQEFPDGLLPHAVYVEEETEQSLECGNTVYSVYNLMKIFPDGTCLLENPCTGEEGIRQLNEINIDWLLTVWNHYLYLSNRRKPDENCMIKLLQLMELVATNLITTRYITDFTIHDVNFIRRTNAETPFVWMVYYSGTHIYALNDAKEIKDFKEMLEHYETYSKQDFCLYRYDGNKLFPVFPKVIKEWIDNELTKYSH